MIAYDLRFQAETRAAGRPSADPVRIAQPADRAGHLRSGWQADPRAGRPPRPRAHRRGAGLDRGADRIRWPGAKAALRADPAAHAPRGGRRAGARQAGARVGLRGQHRVGRLPRAAGNRCCRIAGGRGPWARSARTFDGKVVVVGPTDPIEKDVFDTPTSDSPMAGPGVAGRLDRDDPRRLPAAVLLRLARRRSAGRDGARRSAARPTPLRAAGAAGRAGGARRVPRRGAAGIQRRQRHRRHGTGAGAAPRLRREP